jgi:hypothetical protein
MEARAGAGQDSIPPFQSCDQLFQVTEALNRDSELETNILEVTIQEFFLISGLKQKRDFLLRVHLHRSSQLDTSCIQGEPNSETEISRASTSDYLEDKE